MNDFDAVLERLVTDPGFAASLAADRAAALAGYDLSAEELEVLSAQVGGDPGDVGAVESRVSQSSTFGMFAPLAGAAGFSALLPDVQSGFGQVGASGDAAQATSGFGTGAAPGPPPGEGHGGFGAASGGTAGGQTGLAGLLDGGIGDRLTDFGVEHGFGAAASSGVPEQADTPAAEVVASGARAQEAPPVLDYRTRVDVDGDGDWDTHTYVQRDDGGVDIVADVDRDGRVDFIGHDYDRDGRIDAADYDKNADGILETHMFDDDGDGWMDRKIISPGP